MRDSIFRTAKEYEKLIEKEGEGPRGEYYSFKFKDGTEVPITLESTEVGTSILCRCKFHSIWGPRSNKLCAFKIALTNYKTKKV